MGVKLANESGFLSVWQSRRMAAGRNSSHQNLCLFLTMPLGEAILLTALHLYDKHLFVATLANNFARDLRAAQSRFAELNVYSFATLCSQQDLVKNDRSADFADQFLNLNKLTWFRAVLFAAR